MPKEKSNPPSNSKKSNNNKKDDGSSSPPSPPVKNSRAKVSRAVAEREASRLARPDVPSASFTLPHANKKLSAVTSTPFGLFSNPKRKRSGDGKEEVKEWCGPFSVARQMIAAREEARRKRETEQNEEEDHHPLDEMMTEVEEEEKRKANPSMQWRAKSSQVRASNRRNNVYVARRRRFERSTNPGGRQKVSSLFQMCVDLLVDNFECVEELGGMVDGDMRRVLCRELVAKGKFNGAAFDTLAEVGVESLDIVDCAPVTQVQLCEALQKLLPRGLNAILLNHAGRCFGPDAVNAIIQCCAERNEDNNPEPSSLFAISIGGAYLFTDAHAASLMKAVSGTLSSIEFKACSLLGDLFCNSIRDHFPTTNTNHLAELSLQDLTLSKENLMTIASSHAVHHLLNIKLDNIASLDDQVLQTLFSSTKNTLEGIHLSNAIHITDDTLSSIRRCNGENKLKALQLSGCRGITAIGLEAFFTAGIDGLPDPPNLRQLDLSDLDRGAVTDEIVRLAASSFSSHRKLTNILPSGNRQDSARGYYTPSGSGGLVLLNLSGATSITNKSMESLSEHCSTSLRELNISFCPNLTDQGLGYLVSKIDRNVLSKLHVWGCAQFTEQFWDGHDRVEDGGLEILGVWMKKRIGF